MDDFFEKIKEIKKERGFLIDFEDMDENEENNEGFIEENRSFMAQNYKIEEKPEFMVKKHEKNISIDFPENKLTSNEKKPLEPKKRLVLMKKKPNKMLFEPDQFLHKYCLGSIFSFFSQDFHLS